MKATHDLWIKPFIYGVMCLAFFLYEAACAAESLDETADQLALSSSQEWRNLLHIKNGVSEIDDPQFFLSPQGKTDPHAELHASLQALISDTSDNDQSIYCRFPSRSRWLIEHLPALLNQIQLPQCLEQQKLFHQLNAVSATLVYAAAHINSPASAFGHTFLRLDTALHTPLSAYAINYAAQTNETNGFIYAYQGLFGGYEGRYSMMLYSEKIKEYSELEQRDLWEYTLNLNQAELSRLIYHVFELQPVYANYYFSSENCSYNLLWLLEVARPESALVDQFNHFVAPVDTVRILVAQDFIQEETYRPSFQKKMNAMAVDLQKQDEPLFVSEKQNRYDFGELKTLAADNQVRQLELTVYQLKRQHTQHQIDDRTYKKNLLVLLNERSKIATSVNPVIEAPASPLNAHKMRRLSVAIQENRPSHQSTLTLTGRVAYHDMNDNETGQIPGAFINFLNTEVVMDQHKVKVNQFLPVEIHSYAIGNSLMHPLSWQVDGGVRRIFNDQAYAFLRAGTGLAYGNPAIYGFIMVSGGAYKAHDVSGSWSTMLDAGLMMNVNQVKWGVTVGQEWFSTHQQELTGKLLMTYQLNKDWALNTQVKRIQRTKETDVTQLELRLFYYF